MAYFHCLADVEAKTFRWNESWSKLARMQCDVNPGIDGMEIIQHPHLQRVVAHGNETIFGLHEVDADPGVVMRVHAGLHSFEAKQRLCENLFGRKSAQHLVDVADLYLARASF